LNVSAPPGASSVPGSVTEEMVVAALPTLKITCLGSVPVSTMPMF